MWMDNQNRFPLAFCVDIYCVFTKAVQIHWYKSIHYYKVRLTPLPPYKNPHKLRGIYSTIWKVTLRATLKINQFFFPLVSFSSKNRFTASWKSIGNLSRWASQNWQSTNGFTINHLRFSIQLQFAVGLSNFPQPA